MIRTILPALVLASLAACAQSPASIAPISMTGAFDAVSCAEAAAMLTAERQTLASLEAAQQNAVTGDALGVFLIGVPVSSLSGGDRAGEIAASRGKVIALEQRGLSC